MMEPMFLDTPFTWAFRIGSITVVIAAGVVGFLWYRRLTSVDSEAHVFTATAPGRRRWSAYAIGAGVLLLLVVVAVLLGFSF